ncbi:MAG TPA: riboflavin synthase [Vicinamibacterales bacterium]|nr:riboflavin synthase [Vicinamibacterales bacterium]
MFTGLIEDVGRVARVEPGANARRLRIETGLGAESRPGDSIAVNGVCLTAIATDAEGFDVDVAPETLRVTTLGTFDVGRAVNLERPVRADARLGGHFVLGHVDGVGRIASRRDDGACAWLEVAIPASLAPLVISKGSIAIDGISLTVAALGANLVSVQLVPFTLAHTTLGGAQAGDAVNLEGDVLGKYVARLLAAQADLHAIAGSRP